MPTVLMLSSLLGAHELPFVSAYIKTLCPVYRDNDISLAVISSRDVLPLSSKVNATRLSFAKAMLSDAMHNSLAAFAPRLVTTEDCLIRLILPPVVEVWPDKSVVVDGTHRCYAAVQADCDFMAVLLTGNFPPLPIPATSWSSIQEVNTKLRTGDSMPGIKRSLFRPVAHLLSSDICVFNDVEEFLDEAKTFVEDL